MIKLILLIIISLPAVVHADLVVNKRSVADIERSLNIKTGPDWLCYQEHYVLCPTPKPPYVGKKRVFWVPEFLIETVKAPGEYILVDQHAERRKRELIEAAKKGVLELKGAGEGVSSSSSIQSINSSNLAFSEVHVQSFKPGALLGLTCPSPSSNLPALTKRGTEERFKEWRRKGNFYSEEMGTWGYLNPRTGFMVHASPMVASVASAVKGLYLLQSQPLSNLTIASNLDNDKMQLVPMTLARASMVKPGCVQIGQDLSAYEKNNYSKDGRYAWLYWHRHNDCPCL